MECEYLDDDGAVAWRAATVIAAEANGAVAERGRFVLALSRTPRNMLEALATANIPWTAVHVLQVDERAAPDGSRDRNLTDIADVLLSRTPLVPARLHAMPVWGATKTEAGATRTETGETRTLERAADEYAATLREVAGIPPVIDLVHLGLGPDGHAASLLPGSPALAVENRHVAVTDIHQGYRRMTLTFPVLNGARRILWVVTGQGKSAAFARLLDGDASIPAGRVRRDAALVLATEKGLSGERQRRR